MASPALQRQIVSIRPGGKRFRALCPGHEFPLLRRVTAPGCYGQGWARGLPNICALLLSELR